MSITCFFTIAVALPSFPALGFDTSGGNFTYGTAITGSMGLTKTGPNMLTLLGNNNYTGPTTVSLGTLEIASPGAMLGYYSNTGTDFLTVGTVQRWHWPSAEDGRLPMSRASSLPPTRLALPTGSALGFDTTAGNFPYGLIKGNMGLTKLGTYSLTLTAANTFIGPTTVTGGTLALTNNGALQNSTVAVPTPGVGSISFAGTGTSYAFGGLSGAGYLSLQNTASSAVALTVGGNNSSTTYSGTLNGSGSSTLRKIGAAP